MGLDKILILVPRLNTYTDVGQIKGIPEETQWMHTIDETYDETFQSRGVSSRMTVPPFIGH